MPRRDHLEFPGAGLRHDVEHPVQWLERGDEPVDRVVRHGYEHDPGELAGELGHLAAFPVAAVASDHLGNGVHETSPVIADQRQDERGHPAIVGAAEGDAHNSASSSSSVVEPGASCAAAAALARRRSSSLAGVGTPCSRPIRQISPFR